MASRTRSPATPSASVASSSPVYQGRLELTWTNKHLRLLAREDGSYEWVQPSDYRVAEVRLLDLVESIGEVEAPLGVLDPRSAIRVAKDNLLIRGDALNALTSLSSIPEFGRELVGRVKLAYLDPPFNTQQAFKQYDDALEHSVWLTMIRDRLAVVKKLLAEEGSVWVHVDDTEMAYCRMMMDEVFGRENFIATVIWEKADSPRNSSRWLSTDHDYILVYARHAETWRPNRLPRTERADSIYSNPDQDPRGPWIPGDPFANKPYAKGLYTLVGPSGRSFKPPPGRFWRVSQEKFDELKADGRIWWGPNNDARPSIKRYLNEVADLVPRTLWSRDEVGSNRTSKNEIRRLFPGLESFATPKPERLIARILQIGSQDGDVVLDCFLGSGTTAAVAHKMGRRWIGVEWARDTLDRYAIPRVKQVVEGDDPGGVTQAAGWEGGGGFHILDVAPSMFDDDGGMVTLAEWATNGRLAQATAAQLGYEYEDDPPFSGRKGRVRLAVLDGLVNEQVVRLLVEALPPDERLMVAGTAVDPAAGPVLRSLRPGSVVRKIPASILRGYRDAPRWSSRLGNGSRGGSEASSRD